MSLRDFLIFSLLVVSTWTVGAQPISESELEAHIRFLADPKLEGRGLGSDGLELARMYIEAEFRELGLQPAFEQGYDQPFELLGSTPDPSPQLEIEGAPHLSYGQDFVVFSNHQDLPDRITGELVYGGYLIDAPERNWDDIKGVDLKDKILLVEVNEPGNEEGGLFEGTQMTYYGRWTYKYEQAARLGAKGVLLIHNDKRATYGWGVVRNSWTTEGFTIPSEYMGSSFEGWLTEPVAKEVVAEAGVDYSELLSRAETKSFKPVPLGVHLSLTMKPTFRTVKTSNVGAVLPASGDSPGSSPTIILTAHYDHIGMSTQGEPYSGVVDNTSATAVLLAVARHFSQLESRLPVNLMFVAVSAEEQGLWGSRFLASHLPMPEDKAWANINLEMTNIWGPTKDVYAIGADQSTLDETARVAAEKVGLRYIPELDKENGFFFRSDQFSFARAGIPGLWPTEGPTSIDPAVNIKEKRKQFRAKHYHQTTDSLEVQSREWNLEGTAQIGGWVISMVEELAKQKKRPEFLPSSGFSRE